MWGEAVKKVRYRDSGRDWFAVLLPIQYSDQTFLACNTYSGPLLFPTRRGAQNYNRTLKENRLAGGRVVKVRISPEDVL
jgi:hypothetical protein